MLPSCTRLGHANVGADEPGRRSPPSHGAPRVIVRAQSRSLDTHLASKIRILGRLGRCAEDAVGILSWEEVADATSCRHRGTRASQPARGMESSPTGVTTVPKACWLKMPLKIGEVDAGLRS